MGAKRWWRNIIGALAVFAVGVFIFSCGGETPQKLKVGDQAPDFNSSDLNGHPVSLAAFRGNPVVLRFWSVGCKYCRADTPIFNSYFERYKDNGLKVLYINTQSAEQEVLDFVKDLEIAFPVLLDKQGTITADYQIRLVPQTIIISPDQKVVAARLGGVGEAELRKLLEDYLEIAP